MYVYVYKQQCHQDIYLILKWYEYLGSLKKAKIAASERKYYNPTHLVLKPDYSKKTS